MEIPTNEVDLDAALALGKKLNEEIAANGYAPYEENPDAGCSIYGLTLEDLRKNCCNDMDGTDIGDSSMPAFADEIGKHGVTEVLGYAYVENGLIRLCEVSFALTKEPSEKELDRIMMTTSFHIEGAEAAGGKYWIHGHAE
jgi:hypothetical protein